MGSRNFAPFSLVPRLSFSQKARLLCRSSRMDRVQEINEISTTLSKSRAKLDHYLSKLGWDREYLLKADKSNFINCSVNKEHSVATSSHQQHVYKCKIKSEGLDPKEVCPSSHFFYKNSLAVVPVIIDKKTYERCKHLTKGSLCHEETDFSSKFGHSRDTTLLSGQDQVLSDMPFTMSASKSDLNADQRTMLYDYVIQTAKSIKRHAVEDEMGNLENVAESEDHKDAKNMPKSHLELIAEMRDYKRRRQSYRAKNVHMTKRTNIEVMRDLIETQMKMFQEQGEDYLGD